jgi:hypothetical protein
MTLAEAISTVAMAGCRLMPDDLGGVALVVPPGRTIPREVFEVLRAHREALGAAHGGGGRKSDAEVVTVSHDDLADYLHEQGISDTGLEFVLLAARVFNVRGESITLERPDAGPAEPVFFSPGIPMVTTVSTKWHRPGQGYFDVAAGAIGLVIPDVWAIADADVRHQLERAIMATKKQRKPELVPVWLAGEARGLPRECFSCEGVAVPPGMDLMPWRQITGGAAA